MAISLSKGQNISLSKAAPGLTKIKVGLGWDPRATSGEAFDLDATAFMLKADGKVRSDADMIFYNQLESVCKSVKHTGDNKTGQGAGDDESVDIDLSKVPADVDKIAFAITIHDAATRKQNFGMVTNTVARVVNLADNVEIPGARFDLAEDNSTNTAVIIAEVYRDKAAAGEWKFKAVGQGYDGGLAPLAKNFGVNIG